MAQLQPNEIYEKVEGENIDLVKDIGDFVFSTWKKWHKMPTSLILNVKGLGNNYLRKKKNSRLLDKYVDGKYDYDYPENNVFETELAEAQYRGDKMWLENMLERSYEYDRYIMKKQVVKKIRNENTLYFKEPVIEPKKIREASDFNF